MLGGIIVEFKEPGHRVTMTLSGEKESVRRVADDSEVLEGVEVPRLIELTTTGGADPDLYAKVELRDGSPVLTELSWKSGPGQGEIRQKHLRQTDVAKLVTDLVVSTIRRGQAASVPLMNGDVLDVEAITEHKRLARESKATARRFVERQRLPRVRREMTDEFLQQVADVYRDNFDKAPTKAVGQIFNVQARQASMYVDKARQKGYLPKTVRGQKKA